MSGNKSRLKKMVSITLSRYGFEALEHLSELLDCPRTDLVDGLLCMEMRRRGYTPVEPESKGYGMKVEILLAPGCEPLPIYQHNNELFLEALKDREYYIRLTNQTPKRQLAILSVDGVNAVNGEDASYNGPGWVLNPFQTVNVKGWHRNDNEAAAFVFNMIEASYAKQTGRSGRNVGVIGVATFDEYKKMEPVVRTSATSPGPKLGGHSERRRMKSALEDGDMRRVLRSWKRETTEVEFESEPIGAMDFGDMGTSYNTVVSNDASDKLYSGGAPEILSAVEGMQRRPEMYNSTTTGTGVFLNATPAAAPRAADAGTEFGRLVEMKTTTTDFVRVSSPTEVIQIRYASRAVLESWGIKFATPMPPRPNAFPGATGVPPPPGWRP